MNYNSPVPCQDRPLLLTTLHISSILHYYNSFNPTIEFIIDYLRIQPVTSKRTPHLTTAKINWLMVFKEVITIYIEKRETPK
jgi:hypothetical protein